MKSETFFRLLPGMVASVVLSACGTANLDNIVPDKAVDYKREAQAERDLEIPPDLTSDTIDNQSAAVTGTSYREFEGQRRAAGGRVASGVLPEIGDILVQRDGDERWLLIDGPAETVWTRVVDFWQENGILLQEQDPTVGIMRTAWLENRADIKRDFITDTIRGVFDGLYEAGTRDQYRVRLERGTDPNTTELFLTHFGMEEELASGPSGETDQSVWIPRGRDPGLEAEMLRRIMVYLGQSEEEAKVRLAARGEQAADRARLVKTNAGVSLLINDTFSRAWRLTGLALDRVGFAVEDRNRADGVYYVRYNDPAAQADEEGWLSKLAFWSSSDDVDKENRFQVKLVPSQSLTEASVQDEQGQRLNTPTASRILTLLYEQLR
jgi:outer membrane protein assembly factor BamC